MKRSIIALVLLAGACAKQPDLDRERAAILAADSAWLAAVRARDVDRAVSYWTADARVIGPGQPVLVGGQAIRKMVADGFATPGFSVTWNTTDVVVGPSADVAYSFGTNQFTFPRAGTTAIDTARGQAVVVWRKVNGAWRAAVDTWTPLPTAPPVQ